jgi:Asp-tRNA(Asn)/Glu-tRNA(Gln) amidotransferase B subunit
MAEYISVSQISNYVGQVAKATKGKADPVITKELMLKALEEQGK